jgi:hypothetical protein
MSKFDLDKDGKISEEELRIAREISDEERANRRQTNQRKMAWTALWTMIIFTLVLFSPIISDTRVEALADLLGLFYIAQASIVGAYMGMSAWMNK